MDESVFKFTEDDWVLPELRAFFAVPETRKKIEELAARHKLTPPQTNGLFKAMRHIVMGRITDSDLAERLSDEGNVPFEAAIEVQGDAFADILADVVELLEEQRSIYKDLHQDEFLPPPPPEIDPIESVAREVIEKSGLAPTDPVLRRRLETTAVSRFKDIRDEAETKAMLEKPAKTGGLGMTPAQSATFGLLLNEAMPKLVAAKQGAELQAKDRAEKERLAKERQVQKAKELSSRFGRGIVTAAPAAQAATEAAQSGPVSMTKDDLSVSTVKEELEIKNIEAKVPKKEAFEDTVKTSTALDAAVDEAIAASGIAPADEDLKRRFRTLVSLYFRDLRDALETESKFTMPVASGGMGMSDDDAKKVMSAFKEKNAAYHAAGVNRVLEEKTKYVAERRETVMTEQEKSEQKESEALERAFANLVRKGGGTPPPAPPAQPAQPRVIPVISANAPAVPVPVPPREVATQVAEAGAPPNLPVESMPIPSGSAVPAAPAPQAPPPPPAVTPPAAPAPAAPSASLGASGPMPHPIEPPGPVAPMPSAPAPAPKPATPAIAPSAAPDRPAGQPTVSDVKFTPRLTGPIEELRQLAVKDFRRLSKDPREATLKIKDKIDLLDDLGFEVKTQGIKAWQDSEVNKLYLSILRKSLEGKPVTDVIADMEKKGEPALNKAEFDSIMELNRKLRFG